MIRLAGFDQKGNIRNLYIKMTRKKFASYRMENTKNNNKLFRNQNTKNTNWNRISHVLGYLEMRIYLEKTAMPERQDLLRASSRRGYRV